MDDIEHQNRLIVSAVRMFYDRVEECRKRWPHPKINWKTSSVQEKNDFYRTLNHHKCARGSQIGKAQTQLFRTLEEILCSSSDD